MVNTNGNVIAPRYPSSLLLLNENIIQTWREKKKIKMKRKEFQKILLRNSNATRASPCGHVFHMQFSNFFSFFYYLFKELFALQNYILYTAPL